MNQDKPIIFFGTPNLAAIILEALVSQHPNLIVITQPDKPVGRKHTLTPSPVKVIAQKHHLPVHDYLNSQEIINLLKKHQPGLAVVAAFGKILPQEILKIPKFKTLGVHPSLLPKYRGPTPIQTAVLNGDRETGVTIFLIDAEIDHGPILVQKKAKINSGDTTPILKKKLARLGSQLLIKTLPAWFKGEIKPQPQNHQAATFTKILTKKDGFIEWKNLIRAIQNSHPPQSESIQIDRLIRTYTPWPGVWTEIKFKIQNSKFKTKRLKILKAHLDRKKLVLDHVQLEGKRPVSWKEFERGYLKLSSR